MAKGSSNNMILLLAAAGGAFYGYKQGWFDSILNSLGIGVPNVPATTALPNPTGPTATQVAAALAMVAAKPSATPVPPLGTTVTNAADALRQVAANDAYVIPDAATFVSFQGALPGGYNTVTTTDKGQILLRPDVYAAVSGVLSNRVKRAASAGASATSIQNAGQTTLAEIQTMMSTQGLSGWNDFQRHIAVRTGRVRPVRLVR